MPLHMTWNIGELDQRGGDNLRPKQVVDFVDYSIVVIFKRICEWSYHRQHNGGINPMEYSNLDDDNDAARWKQKLSAIARGNM